MKLVLQIRAHVLSLQLFSEDESAEAGRHVELPRVDFGRRPGAELLGGGAENSKEVDAP